MSPCSLCSASSLACCAASVAPSRNTVLVPASPRVLARISCRLSALRGAERTSTTMASVQAAAGARLNTTPLVSRMRRLPLLATLDRDPVTCNNRCIT